MTQSGHTASCSIITSARDLDRRGLRVVAMVLLTQPQEARGFRYFLMVAAFAALI